MFEVGRDYRIRTIEAGDDGWADSRGVYTVAEVDGTLLRLTNPHSPDLVLNTASWHFHSAELVDRAAPGGRRNIVLDDGEPLPAPSMPTSRRALDFGND